MVGHDILVQGVDLAGVEHKKPVILQMNDDDFPGRVLQDLASPGQPQISNASVVNTQSQPLYQPVQRLLNVAMVDLSCDTLSYPRIDPTRIVSAGLVIRRVYRVAGTPAGTTMDEFDTLSAWMCSPQGKYSWVKLSADQENWDPDPTKRPQLQSGQAALDQQLAAQSLSVANTESTTPAFAAAPAICTALGRTVFYAVIPTASSEVSDTQPASPPAIDRKGLIQSLPALLRSKKHSSKLRLPCVQSIDSRWMSDDFLNTQYPPTVTTSSSGTPVPTPSSEFEWFHSFSTALRMLGTVFNAFDTENADGADILCVLDRYEVALPSGPQPLGQFFQSAYTTLLPVPPKGVAFDSTQTWTPPSTPFTMPTAWSGLKHKDEEELVDKLVTALGPVSQNQLSPQGRYQDSSRYYKLRMFFRIKPESGNCPPKLVWSQYSHHFQIAPWHAAGTRTYPPIPLPDPMSTGFLDSIKPNCSFQVPGSLMNAMQSTTMSGLMNGTAGGGGGGGLSLGWICGFNIPLITICAFFVLNIFLILLNIVFFWLPFIKICIPFPSPSSPEEGSS